MQNANLNRRQFLQISLATMALPLFGKILGQSVFAAAGLIPETDPTAQALSYMHDATKVPASKRVDKMGVAGKDQTCLNCSFYTAAADLNGEKVGKCTLLPAGLVKSKGWCAGWAKKL